MRPTLPEARDQATSRAPAHPPRPAFPPQLTDLPHQPEKAEQRPRSVVSTSAGFGRYAFDERTRHSPVPDRRPLRKCSTPRADLERLCTRNLLETPGQRIFFKDLNSRFPTREQPFLVDQAGGCSGAHTRSGSRTSTFLATRALRQPSRTSKGWSGPGGADRSAKIERETFNDRPDAWVSTTKLPLRDDDGRIIGTFGLSRDVTAQVKAEQALAHQALHDGGSPGSPNRLRHSRTGYPRPC